MIYYDIKEKKKVGRRVYVNNDENGPFRHEIFDGTDWVYDNDLLITDRLLGVDEFEDDDSPYKLGNSGMLNNIDVIEQSEVPKYLAQYYHNYTKFSN